MSTHTKRSKESSKDASKESSRILKKRKRPKSGSRRRISKEDSISLQSLSENSNASTESIKNSQSTIKTPQINYEEEVTMILFRSMLNLFVDKWEFVAPDTEEPSIGAETPEIDDVDQINESHLKSMDLVVSNVEVSGSSKKITSQSQIINVASFQKSSLLGTETLSKSLIKSNKGDKSTTDHFLSEDGEMARSSAECNKPSESLSYQLNIENVKVFFKNGNFYQGPIHRTLFDGFGKFVWKNGTQYEGEFKNGEITGKGTLIYSDLSYYKGEFCNGILNGKGIKYIHSSSMLYNGEWKEGKKHGKGWLLYKPGQWYDGEWCNDYYEGYGIRRYNPQEMYKGNWKNGCRHGSGTMVWKNHDVYIGEWKNGLMDGYGEYTWNAILTKTLVFPIRNVYKGSWLQGMRDGAGIMDFGTEGGAKLAGVWQCNYKHGPGIFLCGNGKTVKGNPLFVFDRPANTHSAYLYKKFFVSNENTAQNGGTLNAEDDKPNDNEDVKDEDGVKSTIKLISQTLYDRRCSSVNLDMGIMDLMKKIENTSYFDPKTEPYQIVGIDMFAPPEQIDVTYYLEFVESIIEASLIRSSLYGIVHEDGKHYTSATDLPKWAGAVATGKNFTKLMQTKEKTFKNSSEKISKFSSELEERLLRETLVKRMLSIKKVYNYYATLTSQKKTRYKVVLVRMMLWQFFRDIDILKYGYSIDDWDLILAENPACNFETDHYPFENIYIWQFLHVILTLGIHMYMFALKSEIDPKKGILANIFSRFLDEVVLTKFGKSRSQCLFEYRDILPINSVYLLYRSFGESKSVKEFLSKTCVRKNETPMCYLSIKKDKPVKKLYGGYNTAFVGDNVFFIKEEKPINAPDAEATPVITDSLFQDSMYIFRLLGPKWVRKSLEHVCPSVVKDGVIVNVDYKLSFIEFYDLLLRCAFIWINKLKSKEILESKKVVGIELPVPPKKQPGKQKKK